LPRSRLERCDKQGMAAYLESSNPQNVPLYEHFGFQVTGVLDLPKGAPAVTTMWRPERSSPPSPVPVTSGKAGEEEAPGCPVAGSAVGGG